jgi:excisionase family DNA binding protein
LSIMEPSSQNIGILTTQEVADFLKVHRSTVTRLALVGELKSYKIGKCRRFKKSDVLAFFENQEDREYAFVKEQK